jgi:hypothetical protein
MKRRDFLFRASSALALTLSGCGGGSSEAVGATPGSPTPAPAGPTSPPSPSAPWVPSGPGLPSLTLHATQTGVMPYLATAFPLEGALPATQVVESPEDPTLRSTVLARWPDGSAQVVAIAGETAVAAGATKSISLRAAAPRGTALGAARVGQLITGIAVDFGAGRVSLTDFSRPERVWWSNERVVCCRYRLPVGLGVVEAVIDVHAFAGSRAFVEVVVENSRMNSASPVLPATQNYVNATVAVNDAIVATVSSPQPGQAFVGRNGSGKYTGGHEPFRAWYCSTWVGGDPGVTVTHDAASMQSHPLFFRAAEGNTLDLQAEYSKSYDTYAPWSPCRVRVPGMGGGGEYDEIGLFTRSQSHYFQTGDRAAAVAVMNHALGALCCDINYRDATSGLVPSAADLAGKSGSSNTWPVSTGSFPGYRAQEPAFESAHQPAHGLVAFLCRPSPVFFEIAQKIFAWNCVDADGGSGNGRHSFDQVRARGWRMRNYGHALFVTPDDLTTWKSSGRAMLVRNKADFDAFLDLPWNTLGVLWGTSPSDWNSYADYSRPRWQTPMWQSSFVVMSMTSIANAKILRGADANAWNTVTDRLSLPFVRMVNEAQAGEWRAVPYAETIGDVVDGPPKRLDMGTGDWGAMRRSDYTGALPAPTGPWLNYSDKQFTWESGSPDLAAGYSYPSQFWGAFCAAVERDIPGAAAAWTKVTNGITNLSTWRQGFRTEPRFNRWPRNK